MRAYNQALIKHKENCIMSDNEKVKVDSGIIAEGEATGHAHRVKTDEAEVYEGPHGREVRVGPHGTIVTHEEHRAIRLSPGIVYDVGIVRERNHIEDRTSEVID